MIISRRKMTDYSNICSLLFVLVGNGKDCEDAICELRLGNYSRNDPTMIECVADNSKSTRISKVFNIDIHCKLN